MDFLQFPKQTLDYRAEREFNKILDKENDYVPALANMGRLKHFERKTCNDHQKLTRK